MKLKICFIGAGNLATHLSRVLLKADYNILQVYSRSIESAKLLANSLNTQFTTEVEAITTEADIYFVALKDSALDVVLPQIDFKNKLVVHCSGSLPLAILENFSTNIGVFYPLQTFSKSRKVDFINIPIFIEANSDCNQKVLTEMADSISSRVTILNSAKRKCLHVAAVFACNFVNHMYSIASDYLDSNDIAFDVLKPLIIETANKVQELSPKEAQTGPAVRFDKSIINDHFDKLAHFSDYQKLYNSISKSIFEHHQEKNR